MNKKILNIENFVVHFPIIFFLLLLPYLFRLSYGKLMGNIIIGLSYFLIPFLIIMLIMRRKEIGSYLRTIGMIHFLGVLILSQQSFPEGFVSMGWGYINMYFYLITGPIFSITLIMLSSVIDIIEVFIKRNELSKVRKISAILYLIIILSFFFLVSDFRDFFMEFLNTFEEFFM